MSNITPQKYRNRKIKVKMISPGKTEQAHKDEVDIHVIMKKYQQTGILDHVNKYKGQYLNMVDAPGFQEAQNIIADALSMFETVPSHIRADFNNDPAQYLEFMQNPENTKAIQAYGLDTSHLPPWEEPSTTPAPTPPLTPETAPPTTPPEATLNPG